MFEEPTSEELWKLFWKYEEKVRNTINVDHRMVSATMVNAIARILSTRSDG